MAKLRKRKAATVAGVGALAAALLLGGTFAWQSISQTALNENRASVNPGARLHDDYSGNYAKSTAKAVSDVGVKRVYVENFTDAQDKVSVIARVRLDEYMEIGGSAGYKKESVTEHGNIVKSDDNGVVRVTEDATTDPSKVTIKIQPIPYQDTQVNMITVKVDNAVQTDPDGDGIYVYDQTVNTGTGTVTPVTIEVSIDTSAAGAYTGDRIKKAESLETGAGINDVKTWKTYIPKVDDNGNLITNSDSLFRKYVTLNFGWDSKYDTTGIYYMPTFNKNKDSLSADINGTYAKGFTDYVTYTANQTKTEDAIYDADSNNVDDANVTSEEETHEAKAIDKTKSKVISMKKWLENPTTGDFWIYDTDGWAYWANLIAPEDATGLFLSRNEMTGKPEDNWYYGMNVVGQFATPGDVGKGSTTGFYEEATRNPSEDAEILLAMLGGAKDKITGADVNQNGSLEIVSGQSTTVSVANTSALSAASLNTIPDGWSSTDEKVAKVEVSGTDAKTATITAKHPGEAYVIYKSTDKLAAIKVTVDYETYKITQENMEDAKTKGIVSYTDVAQEADLVIAGYYPAKDAEDYDDYDTYYQVEIGNSAFSNNKQINSLTIEEGVTAIRNTAFYKCSNLTGNLTIPGSVKRIEGSAFAVCDLTNVVLEEGIETLKSLIFRSNVNLQSINIPYSITYMEGGVFVDNPMLTDLSVPEDHEYICLDDNILYANNMTELLWVMEIRESTEVKIPESVTFIAYGAFRSNKTLQTITVPKSVTYIDDRAFEGCVNLTALNYTGTEEEWNNITKRSAWAGDSSNWIMDKLVYGYSEPIGESE